MKIYKTLFALVALLASVQAAAAITIGGYEISSQATVSTNAVACTMDAMLCPDGVTYVGRTGPSCAFAACPSGISPIPPVSTCVDLQYNLDVGSVDANTNGEVTKLQNFLYPKYLGVPATGAFYGMTKKAVMKFQGEYGISPAVGFVGTITRAKIKQITCGGISENFGIKAITPSYAKVGDTVTLSGPGLNSGNEYVLFDGFRVETDGFDYANRVSFKVPEYLSQTFNCIKAPCPDAPVRLVTPGTYTVQVVNNLGTTNAVNLTVTDGTTLPPVEAAKISWVEPSVAKVGASVVIYGYNLFRPETRILFDGVSIRGTQVYSKRAGNFNSALEFVVPTSISSTSVCTANACTIGTLRTVTPGTYELAVDNKYGRDAVKFEVVGDVVSTKPTLSYVNPAQGIVGTEVSVFGQNINTGSEKVYFAGSQVFPLTSAATDRKGVLRFKIPEYITPCGYEDNTACRMMAQLVTPGKYEIVVKNNNGLSNTVSFTVTSTTIVAPKINSLTPFTGLVGTEVVIQGEGINVGGDKIYFGNSLVSQSTSASSDVVNTLRFKVPEYITPCGVGSDGTCKIASRQVTPGVYEVVVVTSKGTSNTLTFTVTTTTSGTPTISGVSGPQSLNVYQQGTWTVTASNSTGGNLSYSVVWGDEGSASGASSASTQMTSQQTATFTHSYAQSGVYVPRFTVTNANGQSASVSLSVNVGNATVQIPAVSYLSPTYGTVGTRVTVYGSNIDTGSEYVLFDGYRVATDGAKVAGRVSFIVPEYLAFQCNRLKPTDPCPAVAARIVTPGAYSIAIGNTNGVSNTLSFNVISYGIENPLISKFRVEDVATTNSISRKLVWTTQFASSCTASGAWSGVQPVNGSYSIGFMSQPLTYTLTCVNSQGASVSSSVTEPTGSTTQAPVISSASPVSASVGMEVTLSGERLNTGSPRVIFGNGSIIPSVIRANDSVLSFTIPSIMSRYCAPGLYCTDDMIPVTSGSYMVKVINSFGTSNSINVTVNTFSTNAPTISSVSPAAGATNSQVTISGTNLNPASDFVWFGGVKLTPDRFTKALNVLVFTVPTTLNQCSGQFCTDALSQPTPLGNYGIKVENSAGAQSNTLNYEVKSNGGSLNF